MKKIVPILALLLVAACGGNAATQPPASTGATPPRVQASQPGAGGQPIDVAAIQTAVNALKTEHDSWQFTATTYESGTPNFSRTVTGTQRTKPQTAVSATFSQSGQPDKRYVRIADDVWYDTGTGTYTKTNATDNAVVAQFEPYYLDGVVASAESNGYQFQPVGTETVSGVPATHYRLAEATVADIVKNMNGITTADWAADVWIASADGSLLRLAWGPKSTDKAGLTTGVDYIVTSLDCVCPVDPPA